MAMKKRDVPDALAECERILDEKRKSYQGAMVKFQTDEMSLMEAMTLFRSFYDFGSRMSRIMQNNKFTPKWSDFTSRLTARQQDVYSALRGGGTLPRGVPYSREELDALKRLEAVAPPPKVFEGEAEYRRWLKDRGTVEVDPPDDYRSQTRRWESTD